VECADDQRSHPTTIFFLNATSVSPIEKRSTFVVTDQFITIHSKKDGLKIVPSTNEKRRNKNENASFLLLELAPPQISPPAYAAIMSTSSLGYSDYDVF
jgi:hypothetical protein